MAISQYSSITASDITTALNGKASSSHNHDGTYAKTLTSKTGPSSGNLSAMNKGDRIHYVIPADSSYIKTPTTGTFYILFNNGSTTGHSFLGANQNITVTYSNPGYVLIERIS